MEALPASVRSLAPADPPYPVEISSRLKAYQDAVAERFSTG